MSAVISQFFFVKLKNQTYFHLSLYLFHFLDRSFLLANGTQIVLSDGLMLIEQIFVIASVLS